MTTVGEEIDHLRNYLVIQQNRFGDKHEFEFRIAPEFYPLKTMKMLLQPLVENAIFHGLERKVEKGKLLLTIDQADDKLIYVVEDDGVGMNPEPIISSLGRDVSYERVSALKNINDRIQLRFGKDFGLRVESRPNVGTRIEVVLPLLTEGEEAFEAIDRG
jgi:two-component system sensor histidine kinase YesM